MPLDWCSKQGLPLPASHPTSPTPRHRPWSQACFLHPVVQGFQRACLRKQQKRESCTHSVCYGQRQNSNLPKTQTFKGNISHFRCWKDILIFASSIGQENNDIIYPKFQRTTALTMKPLSLFQLLSAMQHFHTPNSSEMQMNCLSCSFPGK